MLVEILSALILLNALPPAQTGKDEFVFNNRGEVESIDPQVSTGVPDNTIVVQLFEGLMARDRDWASLKPGMAESYTVSKDLKTYTFKLRANLKWSDGSPLTAKDFEYSWLRVMRPATLSQYAYWLTDNIAGAKEYAQNPTPELATKVGVKATDDRTFVVTLNKPVPYFLQLAAESVTFPVKKDTVEKHGTAWTRPENIVGNGPFKLTEWKVQDKMVMEKNPHYWDAATVQLKRVVALPIEDRQTAVNLFKQGKLDWSGQNGAPNSMVPAFKDDPNFRVFNSFVTYFYRFNTTRAPLNDVRARQALALAIDRKQLVDKVTKGGETPAHFYVPPGTGSYKSPAGLTTDNYQADLAKAKKLLADAGYPNGKGLRTLNLLYNTDENHKKVALALQQMWKKELGVNVQPFNQEWKVYLKTQESLDYDISRSGWSGDYPGGATFLEMFTSTSGNNLTGWKSEKYDELFALSNSLPDGAKRNEVLQQVETLLLQEAAITTIFFYTNFGFIRPEVVGFTTNLVDRPFVKYFSKK